MVDEKIRKNSNKKLISCGSCKDKRSRCHATRKCGQTFQFEDRYDMETVKVPTLEKRKIYSEIPTIDIIGHETEWVEEEQTLLTSPGEYADRGYYQGGIWNPVHVEVSPPGYKKAVVKIKKQGRAIYGNTTVRSLISEDTIYTEKRVPKIKVSTCDCSTCSCNLCKTKYGCTAPLCNCIFCSYNLGGSLRSKRKRFIIALLFATVVEIVGSSLITFL